MKSIATFFTYFWIFYFPTCIAFNTLPGFSSIDEAMTFILIGYTVMVKSKWCINKKPFKEYYIFLYILTFYIIYSLIWGENIAGGIFLEFLQQIRPYSIIYCTWILNPQLFQKQKDRLALSVVLTLLARTIIRNEGAGGQEDLSAGQMAICAGMIWSVFKDNTKRNRYISVFLVLFGLISATKSKFLGEVICFVGIFFFMKRKFDLFSSKMFFIVIILGSITLGFVWDKFSQYYISGFDEGGMARPESLRVAFTEIIWDYIPFGPGMGTFASNGAWKYYSPLYHKYGLDTVWGLNEGGGFICDIFYPSLAQYGLFGIFLFGWFWKRRLDGLNYIIDIKYYRVALMAFLCIVIEQMADSSLLSGKGMGYCMLIGLCLNANRNQGYTDTGIPIDDEENDDEDEEQEDNIDESSNNETNLREDYYRYHPQKETLK